MALFGGARRQTWREEELKKLQALLGGQTPAALPEGLDLEALARRQPPAQPTVTQQLNSGPAMAGAGPVRKQPGLLGSGGGKKTGQMSQSLSAAPAAAGGQAQTPFANDPRYDDRLTFRERLQDFGSLLGGGEASNRRAYEAARQMGPAAQLFATPASQMSQEERDARLAQMRQTALVLGQQGVDIAPFERMMEGWASEGLASGVAQSLPGPLQAFGRQNPDMGAQHGFQQNRSDIFQAGQNFYRGSPAGGMEHLLEAPTPLPEGFRRDPNNPDAWQPIPGSHRDPNYQYQTEYNAMRGRQDATPPSPPDPITQSQVHGAILAKVAQGGVQSLSPGEAAVWENMQRSNGSDLLAMLLGGGGGGGMGGGQQARAATKAPKRRKARSKAASTSRMASSISAAMAGWCR